MFELKAFWLIVGLALGLCLGWFFSAAGLVAVARKAAEETVNKLREGGI